MKFCFRELRNHKSYKQWNRQGWYYWRRARPKTSLRSTFTIGQVLTMTSWLKRSLSDVRLNFHCVDLRMQSTHASTVLSSYTMELVVRKRWWVAIGSQLVTSLQSKCKRCVTTSVTEILLYATSTIINLPPSILRLRFTSRRLTRHRFSNKKLLW